MSSRIGEVWCHLQMAPTEQDEDDLTLLCTDVIIAGPICGQDLGGVYATLDDRGDYYKVLRTYPSHPSSIYYEPFDQFEESPWKKRLA